MAKKPKFPERPRVFIANEGATLIIRRQVSEEIGFQEHVVFLQIEFLIGNSYDAEFVNNEWWYPSTLEELKDKFFSWWSIPTLSRIIKRLTTEQQLLKVRSKGQDRTQWFAINWESIAKLKTLRVPEQLQKTTQPEPEDDTEEEQESTPGNSHSEKSNFQNEKSNFQSDQADDQNEKSTFNKIHADPKDPSMHGADFEQSTVQPTQTGMDGCMDGIDQDKFNFLWDCGLRSEKLINDLLELPMQTLEKEWALVKNSTNANDKPALLGRNLRIALTRFNIEQRAAAERAANPAAATPAPSNAHPDASRYQRPDFITEAEWYGLRDMAEVYAYLDGAIFDGANGIVCRSDRMTSDLYMKMGGAVLHTRLSAIRNWQPAEGSY